MDEKQKKKKVLFICTHNSARSQMAEGLLNAYFGSDYEGYSAGTKPSKLNPFAVRVMKEIGIDISKQKSKGLEEFTTEKLDFVVTVCDKARDSCPSFPGGKIIHREFKDPSIAKGLVIEVLAAFRRTRDEIAKWINTYFTQQSI